MRLKHGRSANSSFLSRDKCFFLVGQHRKRFTGSFDMHPAVNCTHVCNYPAIFWCPTKLKDVAFKVYLREAKGHITFISVPIFTMKAFHVPNEIVGIDCATIIVLLFTEIRHCSDHGTQCSKR